MDSEQFLHRTVVPINRRGLMAMGTVAALTGLLWLLLAISALQTGFLSHIVVFPASILVAIACGGIAWWGLSRGSNIEPALIIDDVGIFDNVSLSKAGRVRWKELSRIWIVGPRRLRFLCILPDNIRTYLAGKEDWHGNVMRLNYALFGAPVIIPVSALDLTDEEVGVRLLEVVGWRDRTREHPTYIVGS